MGRIPTIAFLVVLAVSAGAQSSMSACGELPDSSARQVIKMSGGVRVCLLATQFTSDEDLPRDWAAKAKTLILETQRDGDNRRAALSGISVTWTINGKEAPQDSLADAWQRAVVDYVDAAFQADELRRQVAALHAEVDSLPARIQAARERIKYLEARDRELNLVILNASDPRAGVRNETAGSKGSVRSEIKRLEAQRSAAESRASSAEAKAAAARDDRTRASYEAQAREARQQAEALEQTAMRLMRRLDDGGSQTVAGAQEELRALQPRQSIALLKLQIANFESVNAGDIERGIKELDAPQRLLALDAQLEKARLALVAILDARGRAPSQ